SASRPIGISATTKSILAQPNRVRTAAFKSSHAIALKANPATSRLQDHHLCDRKSAAMSDLTHTRTENLPLVESAKIALASFGIRQATLTHLANRHNDVFRVGVPARNTYVLRLQNDLMNDAQAAAQLLWLTSLGLQSDVCVPTPVRTKDGRPFTYVPTADGRRRAVLLSWVPGRSAR